MSRSKGPCAGLTEIGEYIDERRQELGIETTKQLAKMAGMSVSALHRIRHEGTSIQRKTAECLAEVLKCETWELLALTPERPAPMRRRPGVPEQFRKSMTICWGCQNAVPDEVRGCRWSRYLEPVDGWTAVESSTVRYDGGCRRVIRSALVIECPEFIPD